MRARVMRELLSAAPDSPRVSSTRNPPATIPTAERCWGPGSGQVLEWNPSRRAYVASASMRRQRLVRACNGEESREEQASFSRPRDRGSRPATASLATPRQTKNAESRPAGSPAPAPASARAKQPRPPRPHRPARTSLSPRERRMATRPPESPRRLPLRRVSGTPTLDLAATWRAPQGRARLVTRRLGRRVRPFKGTPHPLLGPALKLVKHASFLGGAEAWPSPRDQRASALLHHVGRGTYFRG